MEFLSNVRSQMTFGICELQQVPEPDCLVYFRVNIVLLPDDAKGRIRAIRTNFCGQAPVCYKRGVNDTKLHKQCTDN